MNIVYGGSKSKWFIMIKAKEIYVLHSVHVLVFTWYKINLRIVYVIILVQDDSLKTWTKLLQYDTLSDRL